LNTFDSRKVQQFSHLEFIARQVVEGFITGLHKSPFHGFSVEFAEHRLYNKGESTRFIDWKLYGRSDKLFVKRFEEETNLRCQIIIDNSSSMYFPVDEKKKKEQQNKITFSAYCAAALVELLKRQRDAIGLSVFAEKLEMHTPAKSSPVHLKMIMHELEQLIQYQPVRELKKTFAVESLHQIAEAIHKRSLVIIFSDMMDARLSSDDLFSALQHLRHNKHEVILFHVVDKSKEVDFNFDNRPYRFVDLETGEELKVNPAEVKENYLQAMGQFERNLKLHCSQYRIDFIEADINMGFEQVLMPYLLKRTRMQ
jgi:uncharacterized protein (DUF58 family)